MITAVGGKRVLMVLATVIVGGLLFKFCREDRLPPQASDEAQGELLATVQSRITSHAEEYGWSASDIPLKKGVNLESIAFDNSPPPHQKLSYQYETPEGFLGMLVYYEEEIVISAHMVHFFSHSEGASDLQQKFRSRTPLSIRGGTAMEGWLRGEPDPWE